MAGFTESTVSGRARILRMARKVGERQALLAALVWTLMSSPSTAAPDVSEQLQEGRWLEIPNSRLIDVAPSDSPGGTPLKVVAWSGGALDTRRAQVLVWGGGHSDYAGNEVYAFDLGSRQWRRLTEPSVVDRARTTTYPDG